MRVDTTELAGQLDEALELCRSVEQSSRYDDLSDVPSWQCQEALTAVVASVARITGRDSVYSQRVRQILEANRSLPSGAVGPARGVVEALRRDVVAGRLQTLEELVHASMFSDFLEMAEHLLDGQYKDAAAVIIGSSLEAHLRTLCSRHGVEVYRDPDVRSRPKKASTLNADLKKADVYGNLESKSITAWLEIRNNAAHGRYTAYQSDHVRLMLDGVRQFIGHHPA